MSEVLIRVANDIDAALGGTSCQDALMNSNAYQPVVLWCFIAALVRAMKPSSEDLFLMHGLQRLGRFDEWPEARKVATDAAALADVPREHQRDILLGLFEEWGE